MSSFVLIAVFGLLAGHTHACATVADVLARELPGLQLSPVFSRIYGSEDLKGVFLLPTQAAWKGLMAQAVNENVNLKGDKVAATLMSGALALYWLSQNSQLDVSNLQPGSTRLETEARWRCSLPERQDSVGYGMLLQRNASGVFVEHGASQQGYLPQARLEDPVQPVPGTCPGLSVYKVDSVPLPCSSLAALAAEVNDPSQSGCRINADRSVLGALAANGGSHFLQLLIATGQLPAVDKTAREFTLFAPSNAAVEAAASRGAFKYGDLYAKNKTLLAQIVGYHVVTDQSLKQPTQGSAKLLYPTLMQGDAGCGAKVGPTWDADNIVRGGRGVGRAGAAIQACHSSVVPVDALLLPCCAPFRQLLEGGAVGDGYGAGQNTTAITLSPQLQSYLSHVGDALEELSNVTRTVLVPSQPAWTALLRSLARAGVPVDDDVYDGIFRSLTAPNDDVALDVIKLASGPETEKVTLKTSLPDALKSKLCPGGVTGGNHTVTLSPAPAGPAPPVTKRKLLDMAELPSTPPGLEIADGSGRKIKVTGWDETCGGNTILFVDAVPLPCALPEGKEGDGAPGAGPPPPAAQNGAVAPASAARSALVAAVAAALAAAVAL